MNRLLLWDVGVSGNRRHLNTVCVGMTLLLSSSSKVGLAGCNGDIAGKSEILKTNKEKRKMEWP